jgi:hypothetical protein
MTKIEGRQDDDLLSTYGFGGFPSLAVLDASGKAIVKGFNRDLASMQDATTKSSGFLKMRAKVDSGADYDKKAWFYAQLDLDQLTADEARGCAVALGLKGDEAKAVDSRILALEIGEMIAKPNADHGDKVYKWYKSGRRLKNPARGQTDFFKAEVVSGAMRNNDAEAYKSGAAAARKNHENQLKRDRSVLPRIGPAKERFAGNKKVLAQIERDAKMFKERIKRLEKLLAAMDAFEKKHEGK